MEKKCGNCKFKHNTSNDRCFACEKNIASGWQPQTNRQWLGSLSDKALAVEIQALGDNCCLSDILDWLQAEHKE